MPLIQDPTITEDNKDPNWALSMLAGVPSGIFKIFEGAATLGATLLDLGVDKDVIAMPFGPREKMHNINPDRFTEILEEAGCIDRIQGRETFEQYFDLDPVHGVGDVHTV